MFDNIKEIFNTGDNHDKLTWLLVGGVIGFLIKLVLDSLWKLIKFITKKTFKAISRLFSIKVKKINNVIKVTRDRSRYKRMIKQIEKREIEIPPFFLARKSRESNPELKKIYQMIDDGLIEKPVSERIGHIDMDKIISQAKLVDPINQVADSVSKNIQKWNK